MIKVGHFIKILDAEPFDYEVSVGDIMEITHIYERTRYDMHYRFRAFSDKNNVRDFNELDFKYDYLTLVDPREIKEEESENRFEELEKRVARLERELGIKNS